MSTPVLWILLPLALGVGLWWLQYRRGLVAAIASLTMALLGFLAWLLPLNVTLRLGPLALRLTPTLTVFGRTLTLDAGDQPFLALIFFAAAFWFAASWAAGANPLFVPLALCMTAFLVAALAVEPFLYAALLIEMAVLCSIPFLGPPGEPARKGVIRYLIFQTLGMPFILFTGWMLTGVEAGSADLLQVTRAGLLLGLGFAFLLAVFPFYTWMPLLSEQSHPFPSGFVLATLPVFILMFGLTFMDRYSWLRDTPQLYLGLRTIGALMIVTGGIWAAFQKHLGRMLAYGVIVETGFLLLAIGLPGGQGPRSFAMLLLPRLLGMSVWTVTLSVFQARLGSLRFEALRGALGTLPLASLALVTAIFSVAGLPLLADFPVKQIIIQAVAADSYSLAAWVLLGSFGLLAGGLRALAALLSDFVFGQTRLTWGESRSQLALLGLGALFLLLMGLFPQGFLPGMVRVLAQFTHLF